MNSVGGWSGAQQKYFVGLRSVKILVEFAEFVSASDLHLSRPYGNTNARIGMPTTSDVRVGPKTVVHHWPYTSVSRQPRGVAHTIARNLARNAQGRRRVRRPYDGVHMLWILSSWIMGYRDPGWCWLG